MSSWKITTIGREADLLCGFPFKSETYSKSGDGVRLLRGDNIAQGRLDWTDAKRLPHDLAAGFDAYQLQRNDVVLAMDRPWIGAGLKQAALTDQDLPALLVQRTTRVRGGSNAKTEFLRYVLSSPSYTNYIKRITTGSLVPHISKAQIADFLFLLPSLEEQERIADTLLALDDKIDLNNRINEELEGMAKLLYDYWFVQFDFPITAAQAASMGNPSIEGKPYRASGGKMTYNETLKREIPIEWLPGTAAELFDFNPAVTLKQGAIAGYFDMDAVPTRGFMTKKAQKKPFSGGTKFANGDVVVARITPCLENGKTALITQLEDDQVGFGSTEFIVMRGKGISISAFGACLARSQHFRKFAIRNMTGTSGRKRIEAVVLKTIPLPIPSQEVLANFEEFCGPMFKAMTENEKQNQELTALRDWLLPMLMNGQVTVK